jgi:peptide/nickel transport system permease protein
MRRLLINKLLLGLLYLFVISLAAFFLVRQMPGDPAEIIANQGRDTEAPPELVEQIRHEYGFDRSISSQYILWLERILLKRELGTSTRSGQSVLTEIKSSLPISLRLGLAAFLCTTLISVPLGLYAGVTRSRAADLVIQIGTWTLFSIPVFLLGTLAIWYAAVELRLLPAIGASSWKHYILPVGVLSLHLSAWTVQIIRSSVHEIVSKPYIMVARAKGLAPLRIVTVHVLKPALLPIATALLLQLGSLVSGSFIIETIFAWNGIGRLLIESILARDFPVIQGVLLYVGSIFALINIVIDLLYLVIQPGSASRLGKTNSARAQG